MASTPIYVLVLNLAKISIILFYLRLCYLYPTFCRVCYVFLALVLANMVIWLILPFVQCTRLDYNWDRYHRQYDEDVSCLNQTRLILSMSVMNIVLDAMILVLPIPLILKMRSTLTQKLAIIFMFSLGIIVLIASCNRLRYTIAFGTSTNITWDYVDLMIWTGVETAAAVTAPSLPTIRLLMHRLCPAVFGRIFAVGSDHERELQGPGDGEEAFAQDFEGLHRPKGILSRRLGRGRRGGGGEKGQDLDRPKMDRRGRTEASRVLMSIDDDAPDLDPHLVSRPPGAAPVSGEPETRSDSASDFTIDSTCLARFSDGEKLNHEPYARETHG